LRPGARSRRDMIRVFVGTSALLHLVLILTLPVGLFVSPDRGTMSKTADGPSELTIMRVMEIASQVSERPSLPPEQDLEAATEISEVAPIVAPARAAGAAPEPGKRGSGNVSSAPGKYTAPVPVIMTWPEYPSSARRRGVRGTIIVRVHVTAYGRVDRTEVVSGLEDIACRRAALKAAEKLRFLPATLGGQPVDAWFSYPVEFGRKR
jgi:TonB family protein